MPQGHVLGTPEGRVRLASVCTGVGVGYRVRGTGAPQPLGQGKAEKPIAVLRLQLSQAVGPFPLSFCISAGALLS